MEYEYRYYLLVGCVCTVITLSLVILFSPFIPHRVSGKLTDYMLNDNGFQLKIDNEIFDLSYGFQGNLSMPPIIPCNITIEYYTCLVFPQGSIPYYAYTISIVEID